MAHANPWDRDKQNAEQAYKNTFMTHPAPTSACENCGHPKSWHEGTRKPQCNYCSCHDCQSSGLAPAKEEKCFIGGCNEDGNHRIVAQVYYCDAHFKESKAPSPSIEEIVQGVWNIMSGEDTERFTGMRRWDVLNDFLREKLASIEKAGEERGEAKFRAAAIRAVEKMAFDKREDFYCEECSSDEVKDCPCLSMAAETLKTLTP